MAKKIKVDNELYDQLKAACDAAGYGSLDEYVGHILEQAVAALNQQEDADPDVIERLKGLGYIS